MAKNNEKYAYLDRLSTEQLERLIRADYESDESSDEDAIFHILEVLVQREKERSVVRTPDLQEARAEFERYYNIPEGEGISLYPMSDVKGTEERSNATLKVVPKATSRRHWLRRAVVAASAAAILMGVLVCAQAAGLDVFGALARWTDETFHFVADNRSTGERGTNLPKAQEYQETYEAINAVLIELGIEEDLAPTWYPDDFVMDEPVVLSDEFGDTVCCLFSNADDVSLIIQVQQFASSDDLALLSFEKDENLVETYTHNGKTFYIMDNLENQTAAWSNGNTLAMNISGKISIDTIKTMIDSIGG